METETKKQEEQVKENAKQASQAKKKDNFEKDNKPFIDALAKGLRAMAEKDPSLIPIFKKESKNIVDCAKFVIEEVRKTGRQGFSDEEIFGIAVHYFDEDDLKAPASVAKCNIITNTSVQLTEEEIRQAKEKARQEIINAEKIRLTAKTTPKPAQTKKETPQPMMKSLFDGML